jgi:hypothetical protein
VAGAGHRVRSGGYLALLSMLVFAPPVAIALTLLGVASLARAPYVAFKAAFSAVEGAIVTPFIVWMYLAELVRE